MIDVLKLPYRIIFLFVLLLASPVTKAQKPDFVKTKDAQFLINGTPYYYIGTNYWYGGLLALKDDPTTGKDRLVNELDFLKSQGVNNLRVLVGSEGAGRINGVDRVQPVLQPEHQIFDAKFLMGLDFLLMEMAKRKMYAVLYLSNNWEWSGGFLQYVNWNQQIDEATLKRKLTWDEQTTYTSKFYACEPCKMDYLKQLNFILKRRNHYTGKKYINEPAIMAWELANEPRPMRPEMIDAYKKWISLTADHIKSIDKNHLVTIGSEGLMGTAESMDLFKEIHAYKSVDYLTIHIWPKNWDWFKDSPTSKNIHSIIDRTSAYIKQHELVAQALQKPLVIEEFGLPRDGHAFDPSASTKFRDQYFDSIFSLWASSRDHNGAIAGCNIWAFGGQFRPINGQIFWKEGDDFSGDPPQEEQGLNSVFDSDESTWRIINGYIE